MTEPHPNDLTAQLAQLVSETWSRKHAFSCAIPNCRGHESDCVIPKPSALVAYEQAQERIERVAAEPTGGADVAGETLAPARHSSYCVCNPCQTKRATACEPGPVYVLMREANGCSAESLRVYESQRLADDACALLCLSGASVFSYRVHAVPRVE